MSRNALSPEQVRELASQVVHGIPTVLPVEDYSYWMTHGTELNTAIAGVLRRNSQPAQVLLKLVTTITLPAIEIFKALDHFKVGEVEGVKLGWIGDNFQGAFLAGDGKVETKVAEATLLVHQLRRASVDTPIIAELGGEEVAKTTLAQMWEMMKAQGHGQKGNLLVNGCVNIFYIPDADGTLWAVYCVWRLDCGHWRVAAVPLTRPYEWDGGYQVVSR